LFACHGWPHWHCPYRLVRFLCGGVGADRSVVQSARRRLLAYLYWLFLLWRLTPVVVPVVPDFWLSCSCISESRGLPRSSFCDAVSHVFVSSKLPSGKASSSCLPVTPADIPHLRITPMAHVGTVGSCSFNSISPMVILTLSVVDGHHDAVDSFLVRFRFKNPLLWCCR
jgi:hypothetical protein